MLKRNVKLFAALAVVASISTGFATVHAASTASGTASANKQYAGNFKRGEGKDFIKTKLDALVTAGTITSDQETAALNLITPDKNCKADKESFFKTKLDTLVTAGTITNDQETSVLSIYTAKPSGTAAANAADTVKRHGGNSFKAHLDALVAKGTITKDQETAITNLLAPNKGVNQGKENFLKSKLDTLVTSGTITQAQEDSMLNSITAK